MINALAFSVHPNGVVVYVVFFLGILFNFKSFKVKDYFFLVFTFLLSTVIFFKLLVFDTSLQGVISDFQNYRGIEYKFLSGTHSLPRFCCILSLSLFFLLLLEGRSFLRKP